MQNPKKEIKIYHLIGLYLFLALIFTFPLIFYLRSHIFAQSGDSIGTLYYFWTSKTQPIIYNFPNQPLFIGLAKLSTRLWGEIITYNIFVLSSFILTGLSGFLLIKKISRNTIVALFGSLILLLLPFRITQTFQHLNFADISGILFFIYFLITAKENPCFKNIFLSGLFFTLTTLWNYQYGFFSAMILLTFLIISLIEYLAFRKIKNKTNFRVVINSLLVTALFAVIIGLFNYQVIKDLIALQSNQPAKVLPIRDVNEINYYSAKWFYYLLPSPDNPLLSRFTQNKYDVIVEELGTNRTEQVNYLGIVPLLFVLYYLWQFVKNKTETNFIRYPDVAYLFIFLAIFSLILSFSEQWNLWGLKIDSPAKFLFQYLPFFRVYNRFGLLVGISVAILASMGLSLVLERIKKPVLQTLFLVTCALLLVTELLVWPNQRLMAVNYPAMPKIYQILAQQSKGILAEYPYLSNNQPKGYSYLLWQRYHQMPMIYNMESNDSTKNSFRKQVLDIANPLTWEKLNNMGVKYVIIHLDQYTGDNARKHPAEYNDGKPPKIESDKLQLLAQFATDELYLLGDR